MEDHSHFVSVIRHTGRHLGRVYSRWLPFQCMFHGCWQSHEGRHPQFHRRKLVLGSLRCQTLRTRLRRHLLAAWFTASSLPMFQQTHWKHWGPGTNITASTLSENWIKIDEKDTTLVEIKRRHCWHCLPKGCFTEAVETTDNERTSIIIAELSFSIC